MKKLLIAVLLVAVMAVPAFASVQNVKVSGDLTTTWALRSEFNLGVNSGATKQNMNDFLSYTRVRIDADLTDNVSTTVRLLNERPWGDDKITSSSDATSNEDVLIDLAYVQLREMLYSPLTVTVGRQELFYGNGFIIGGNGPNNQTIGTLNKDGLRDLSKRNSLDAVKAVLNYDPLTIDMFMAKSSNTHIGLNIADKNDDIDVYGFNANYKLSDKWNTVAEGYFFAKEDKTTDVSSTQKSDRIYVPGFRVSTNPIKGLNLQGELAWQRGTDYIGAPTASPRREAMGGQFIASYLLPFEKTAKYEPVLAYAYTYVSGDKDMSSTGNPGDKNKAWDPMFEHVSGGKIYNALFDLTNVHVNEFSLSVKPVKDLTTKATFTMLSLDKKLNSTSWTPNNATSDTYTVKTDKRNLGNEVDLDLTYAYTEDVSIGMSAGWFMPGNLFADSNEKNATQLLTSMTVNF
ncbi:MAG TPA: alginate export family protein [Candidatus Omnitrophota bacterium]|nr:alginate export family protein [Candidatus Omnitrophota bacterium]